jgi:hypothetical protein
MVDHHKALTTKNFCTCLAKCKSLEAVGVTKKFQKGHYCFGAEAVAKYLFLDMLT